VLTVKRSPEQVPFVLRMPLDLREELATLARRDERSLAYILRRLVRLGLQAEQARCTAEDVDARP
jgi:hypothetical protein